MHASYERYKHCLAATYRQFGLEIGDTFAEWSTLDGLGPVEVMAAIAPRIRERLDRLVEPQGSGVFLEPRHRVMHFRSKPCIIPLINEQAVEWYGTSPIFNYDFIVEDALGLLTGARVVHDLGGHQGVWALFYASVLGPTGRVYTFEPSTVNVEASALAFLLNRADNIINVGAGVSAAPPPVKRFAGLAGFGEASAADKMLIDFKGSIPLVEFGKIAWDRADFLKMDIEGYEYDLITEHPWIFDVARHMHIEIHIPHLERRNVDYRDIIRLIPFDKFEIFNCQNLRVDPIGPETELSGYCSLMMKRRSI